MKRLSTTSAIMLMVIPMTANTDTVSISLKVKPSRCIALQQGQSCFADLTFRWSTPETGDYCLFDERQANPLVCWAGNELASYKVAFKSDINVKYEIRTSTDATAGSTNSEHALAQTLVKISWVYKSNNPSTSRWRLF